MSNITAFEDWFTKLTNEEKKEIILHVVKNHVKQLNEGYYGGPSGYLQKGLFAGPAGTTSSKICPVCGKPF